MKAAISSMVNKAVFFDRDGVLNVDVHYLYRPEDFVWTEGAMEAIKFCNQHGYLVIVVTNQSGVARGYYTEQDVQELHRWMNAELRNKDAHIDAFYYCPHHPDAQMALYRQACDCRKPKPGMVEAACQRFQIDKSQSLFIGDKASDMECAANAGVRGIQFFGGNLLAQVEMLIAVEKHI